MLAALSHCSLNIDQDAGATRLTLMTMSSSPGLEHIASVKVPPLSIAILAVAAALELSPFGDMADFGWRECIALGQ